MEFGYPRTMVLDHGCQLLTQFEEWCVDKGIVHDDQKSSPYNHRANENAEATVKLLKSLPCCTTRIFRMPPGEVYYCPTYGHCPLVKISPSSLPFLSALPSGHFSLFHSFISRQLTICAKRRNILSVHSHLALSTHTHFTNHTLLH